MATPIVILAGQSNASRIAGEITDALNATYGAGNYELVRAWSSGAPLTSARDGKTDWETPGEMRTQIVTDTVAALKATPDGYVAGIFWVQGEGDTDQSGSPADYASDFHDLFNEFRAGVSAQTGNRATGVENAPIVISGLSDHAPASSARQHWDAIQSELIKLGARNDGIVTVRPDSVMTGAGVAPSDMFADGLHYSDPASVALATGLVSALLDLSVSGSGGADTLIGTKADDIFTVDHSGDVIIEPDNGGTDLVRSSVDFALRDYGMALENLTLTGSGHVDGTGNGTHNVLTGNAGNNALNGAWGNDVLYGMAGNDILQDTRGDDTLVGGTGNDTYFVDSDADVVIELAGQGHDQINSSINYRLWADAPDVEDLTLTGSADIDGTGNGWDNRITGNSGDNTLDGARGDDTLDGGAGADTLIGQSGADSLLGGAGHDELHGDQIGGATETEVAGMAFRLYQTTLDRAPDYAGFDYWTDELKAGANYFDIVAGFVNSPEFQRTYGKVSDAEFVELLYQNVLDRNSDAGGKAAWMKFLSDGAKREEVVTHFSESPEFKGKTAEATENWVRDLGTDDVLDPGAGNSTLTGGDLSDVFVFRSTSDGTHVISDFEDWDTLDLTGFNYGSIAEAMQDFTQSGEDLVFDSDGVTVILQDMALEDLSTQALLV